VFTGPVDELLVLGGLAVAASMGSSWAQQSLDSLSTWVTSQKDASESKPTNCPPGTVPIDEAKKKFGLDKDKIHGIKSGVNAKPRTWTGIDPNGNVWTGGPGGIGENHGPFGDYLPGRR